MQGYKTLWIPGTDHAGIATQNVVEKQLKKKDCRVINLEGKNFLKKFGNGKKNTAELF